MAVTYTYAEQTDMLLVLGYCEGNCRRSVRVYGERFPNRRVPNHKTFANIERRLRETGSFRPATANRGRARSIRTPHVEEEILERIEENPGVSSRCLGLEVGVSKNVVHRVLQEQMLYPYHVQGVQELLLADPDARLAFCRFIQERRAEDMNFHNKILFTDEACFTRRGMTNFHNEHVYADENPHVSKQRHFQNEFRINVWTGIIGNFVIGPVILPIRLNGASYLDFLENTLPDLLEHLPLALRRDMWFLHDGAPPHFTLNVRNHLNIQFPNKWIGRGADSPVNWPPRSPDLNICDSFFWGALKSKVYSSPINTEDELWARIQNVSQSIKNNAEMLQRVQFNFLRRINLCIQENGGHFEHLL